MKRLFIFLVFSVFALQGCDFVKGLFGKSLPQNQQSESAPTAAPAEVTADQAEIDSAQQAQRAKAEAAPKDTIWPPAPGLAKCKDGSLAKAVTGSCTGQWTIRTNSYPSACLFTWGPEATCPKGTVPVGRPNACFGYIAKPIPLEEKNTTPEDCIKKHGETPSTPTYELQCCPE